MAPLSYHMQVARESQGLLDNVMVHANGHLEMLHLLFAHGAAPLPYKRNTIHTDTLLATYEAWKREHLLPLVQEHLIPDLARLVLTFV
jgi:hypothetical protein